MEQVLITLARVLHKQWFLAAAILIEVACLIAAPNSKAMEKYFWYAQVPSLTLVLLQFWYNVHITRKRSGTPFEKGELLTNLIVESLDEFKGTFDVFNAEMNTLRNPRFWDTICHLSGVRQVRIAVPPLVFKRFESKLQDNALWNVFGKYKDKVRVMPVDPAERPSYAFALLNADNDSKAKSKLFQFPKIEPYAKLTSADESTPEDGAHVEYEYVIVSGACDLLDDARAWFLNNWEDERSYTTTEMRDFAIGKKIDPEQVAQIHGLNQMEPIMALHLATQKCVISDAALDDRAREYKFNAVKEISSSFGTGVAYLRVQRSEGRRPVFVWLPPWGFPDWPRRMRRLDEEIQQHANIVHLGAYSMALGQFCVSGAIQDAAALIRDIVDSPEDYGSDGTIILAGVSISAFVAAEVAAQFPADVKRLCMLSPVVDVFDALDSFRSQKDVLMTRAVYYGKLGFTVPSLIADGQRLRLFAANAGPNFVVDLPLRGAQASSIRHVRGCLATYLRTRTNRVLIASHRHDEMTLWSQIQAIAADYPQGGTLECLELDWIHDIHEKNKFVCGLPDAIEESAWGDVLSFALEDRPAGDDSRREVGRRRDLGAKMARLEPAGVRA